MIVIPMAGESRRFREAGYDQPKYMLPLDVAPLYNHLIAEGRAIGFEVIGRDEVIFCGVPAEYEALLAQET